MTKSKPLTAMPRSRAQHFSGRTRNGIVGWDVQPVPQEAISITVDLRVGPEKREETYTIIVDAQDAYEIREAIGHAYDRIYGL
jgi:hypothetical protein